MVRCNGMIEGKHWNKVRCPKGSVQNIGNQHFCEDHKKTIEWYQKNQANWATHIEQRDKRIHDELVDNTRDKIRFEIEKGELEKEIDRQKKMEAKA